MINTPVRSRVCETACCAKARSALSLTLCCIRSVEVLEGAERVVVPDMPGTDERMREGRGLGAADLARSLRTTIIPGWFYAVDDRTTVNYSSVVTPDGDETDRYDKVRTVPFGEFVPLRGLLEALGVTGRDHGRDFCRPVQLADLDSAQR